MIAVAFLGRAPSVVRLVCFLRCLFLVHMLLLLLQIGQEGISLLDPPSVRFDDEVGLGAREFDHLARRIVVADLVISQLIELVLAAIELGHLVLLSELCVEEWLLAQPLDFVTCLASGVSFAACGYQQSSLWLDRFEGPQSGCCHRVCS